jgi:hypothetical protein
MRSPIAAITFTVGILLIGAGSASADPVSVGQIIQLQLPSVPRFSNGGPFVADLPGVTNDFLTFCLEYNEHFVPGEDLMIRDISNEARSGGVSGSTGSGDPIGAATAFLYSKFRSGTAGYTNGALMQQAIWHLEGELAAAEGSAAYNLAMLAGSAVVGHEAYYLSQVRVLNLYRGPDFSWRAQDMLTYTPVPEPTSLLLLGLGMAGAAVVRRKTR